MRVAAIIRSWVNAASWSWAHRCEGLGHLDFLPQAAEDLYAVMTDPERGGCVPALPATGLLVDPTVTEARAAIEQAFDRAAKDEATLFLVYVGHGEFSGSDHYLLPKDAGLPPRSNTAIHSIRLILEPFGRRSRRSFRIHLSRTSKSSAPSRSS